METEQRFSTGPGQVTGRTVTGHAALFNTRSENLGTASQPVFEIIARGAFDEVLKDDVRALFNHDPNQILARSKGGNGTLKLSVDNVGLRYQFEAPETQLGNDLLVSLRRGDIDQSSFSFAVVPSGTEWRNEGQARIRTITKFSRLFDISIVCVPAYSDTTAAARSGVTFPQATSLDNWRRRFKLISKSPNSNL